MQVAVFSMRDEPIVARLSWRGFDQPPIEAQIEPGALMHLRVDRPAPPKPGVIGMPGPPEPGRFILLVEATGRQWEIPFGPRVTQARPPGVFFHPLAAPMTLADVQTSRRLGVGNDYATHVHLRKLGGRWEVFFESHRPQFAPMPQGQEVELPETLRSYDDLRGIEAVTLFLGSNDIAAETTSPAIWLTVPENGFWRLMRGVNDGTLQVHRKSFVDRWYCRVVLPDSWCLPDTAGDPTLLMGCLRSHGDASQIEAGPNITIPWRADVSRAAIDLTEWDDLPSPN